MESRTNGVPLRKCVTASEEMKTKPLLNTCHRSSIIVDESYLSTLTQDLLICVMKSHKFGITLRRLGMRTSILHYANLWQNLLN